MVEIPTDELMAMPYDMDKGELHLRKGELVIELGNKKNRTGLYREFYEHHGLRYVCLDWNGQDGAISFDMGKPLPDNVLEIILNNDIAMVTNFGFMEHVYTDQVQAWQNVSVMCPPETWLAMSMPTPGYWEHHGVYQPTMKWYAEWLDKNGFCVHTFSEVERVARKRHMNVVGATREDSVPYHHPDMHLVHITPVNQRRNPAERNCGVTP